MPEGHSPGWETSAELPPAAITALRRPVGEVVTIVATVDADGAPRTAAFGSVRPVTGRELRVGCDRRHDTFANVVRDGRVMLALVAPPDVAIGVRGHARVLKEHMQTWPSDAVIAIDVAAVKSDFLPVAPIVTGITYAVTEELAARLAAYIDEVEAAD